MPKLQEPTRTESWQSFRWPGDTYKPGTMLTWTSTSAGARLYGDYQGTWGLIRWLEQAKQQKLDEGRYQLTFITPDMKRIRPGIGGGNVRAPAAWALSA